MWEIIFLVLFVVASATHLYASWVENIKLIIVSKPLLMPLLVVFYILSGFDWLILVGVIFGFLGDVFLLKKDDEKFFLLGLASFLIGHILYIIGFAASISQGSHAVNYLSLLVLLPFALYGLWYFKFVKDDLGDKKIPVLVYMIIILTMSLLSILRLTAFQTVGAWLVFIGSLLFIVSDSVLALEAFSSKVTIPRGRVIVMTTYILAQYLIVQGFILQ